MYINSTNQSNATTLTIKDLIFATFFIAENCNWDVNNVPKMQFFTGLSRNAQSKSYMLSLTWYGWEFRNNALWDTHEHALLPQKSVLAPLKL